MEIVFNQCFYKKKLKNITTTITSGKIYGCFGEYSLDLARLLTKKNTLTKGNIEGINKKSNAVIINYDSFGFFTTTVKKEINFYCNIKKVKDKRFKEKIEKLIQAFSLNNNFINKKISELSSSEKYLFYVLLNTIFDFDIIIFNNLYGCLDHNNRKLIVNLLHEFINEDKIVIIIDNDINNLYDLTDYILILKDGYIKFEGNTKDILTNVEELTKFGIPVPDLSMITYLAKLKKNIKLFYHSDVRDIIKDIYKHV